MTGFELGKRAASDFSAAAIRNFQRQTSMTIEQHPGVFTVKARQAMQLGNDHHGKLQSLSLMDRHQTNCICCFVNLPFTFTTTDRFKLLDVTDKVANQMVSRAFETRRECEQTLHIRESLCAIEVCRNHGGVLRFINGKAQQILARIMVPTLNQTTD